MSDATTTVFELVAEESAVLIEARSTVGLISFGMTAMSCDFEAVLSDGTIDADEPIRALLTLPVAALTSGNQLYDAEIRDRLNAKRFPTITAELATAELISAEPPDARQYAVAGNLTIHGTNREQAGTVEVALSDRQAAGELDRITAVVTGTQVVDVRDFNIDLPQLLMLQIYPDVTVRFRITVVAPGVLDDRSTSGG